MGVLVLESFSHKLHVFPTFRSESPRSWNTLTASRWTSYRSNTRLSVTYWKTWGEQMWFHQHVFLNWSTAVALCEKVIDYFSLFFNPLLLFCFHCFKQDSASKCVEILTSRSSTWWLGSPSGGGPVFFIVSYRLSFWIQISGNTRMNFFTWCAESCTLLVFPEFLDKKLFVKSEHELAKWLNLWPISAANWSGNQGILS